MAKRNSYQKVSPQTQDEAMKVAKATQRPGQTKEQTRLIAQGIQKGIEQYKKQQKAKARELDKKLKKVRQQAEDEIESSSMSPEGVVKPCTKLPWFLLLLSWIGFLSYQFIKG